MLEKSTTIDAGAADRPAIFTNWFQTTVSPQMVRLSLSEMAEPGSEPKCRGAFVMSHQDARELGELLCRMTGAPPAVAN